MTGSVVQFAAITALLVFASAMDIKTREIPNQLSVGIAISAFLDFNIQNLWGIIPTAIFFFTALFTGKIGGGDVKLIAALSIVCGLWGSLALLLFSQISMLIYYGLSVIIQKFHGRTASKSLPFVPFITFGYVLTTILF